VSSNRVIFLADLDTFFVEVERLANPDLIGKPVVVGGRPGGRGVILAASYEARVFGIKSGISGYEAEKLAKGHPEIIFLHDAAVGGYNEYSKMVRQVLEEGSPDFHARSIDEFEMNFTGCDRWVDQLHGGYIAYAHELRRRVREKTKLPLSIGIGPNRMIAKMASRHAKPDGVFRVLPDQARTFASIHKVRDVPGIGPSTEKRLNKAGIETVGQLFEWNETLLSRTHGLWLYKTTRALKCQDVEKAEKRVVFGEYLRRPKSIGHQSTLWADVDDPKELSGVLWKLTERSCKRLRKKNLTTRHVTVMLRWPGFKTVTHGGRLGTESRIESEIFPKALEYFHQAWDGRPLRLVGIRLEDLESAEERPFLIRHETQEKGERLFGAVDRIRERFGDKSLAVGPGTRRLKKQHVKPELHPNSHGFGLLIQQGEETREEESTPV